MKNFSKSMAVLAVFMLLLSGCGKHDKKDKRSYEPKQETVQVSEDTKTEEVSEDPEVVLEEIVENSEVLLQEEVDLEQELDDLESLDF